MYKYRKIKFIKVIIILLDFAKIAGNKQKKIILKLLYLLLFNQ